MYAFSLVFIVQVCYPKSVVMIICNLTVLSISADCSKGAITLLTESIFCSWIAIFNVDLIGHFETFFSCCFHPKLIPDKRAWFSCLNLDVPCQWRCHSKSCLNFRYRTSAMFWRMLLKFRQMNQRSSPEFIYHLSNIQTFVLVISKCFMSMISFRKKAMEINIFSTKYNSIVHFLSEKVRISEYSSNLFLAVLWGFRGHWFSGRGFSSHLLCQPSNHFVACHCRIRCYFEFCSLTQRLFMDFFKVMILTVRSDIRTSSPLASSMLLRKICLLAFSPLANLLFALKQKTSSRGAENPRPSPCSQFWQAAICQVRKERWAGISPGRGGNGLWHHWIPILLSKEGKKTQTETETQTLGCVQLDVNVRMHMHSQ